MAFVLHFEATTLLLGMFYVAFRNVDGFFAFQTEKYVLRHLDKRC